MFLGETALLAVVQLGLEGASYRPLLPPLAVLLFLFFSAFNVLEATQPSLASRIAPPRSRGAGLGVYNTLQSLGFFVGGAVGGWMAKNVGVPVRREHPAEAVWLAVTSPTHAPRARQSAEEVLADEAQAT